MEFKELDFSMFHPLDHWPGTRRCREHYGSWRQHLSLAWEFKWSTRLASMTLCRIGKHRRVMGSKAGGPEQPMCWHCDKCL